jgi:hypothetical protein
MTNLTKKVNSDNNLRADGVPFSGERDWWQYVLFIPSIVA